MDNKISLRKAYKKYCGAVAYVAVLDDKENEGIGSAFHVGEGIFVTAKHVVKGKKIKEVATTKRIEIEIESEAPHASVKYIYPKVLELVDGPHYAEDDSADVAVFRVKSKDLLMPGIPLGYHTNNSIDDNSFVLQDAVIIGYPPIPFTVTPNQVVASGQVSAVIDVWHSKYAHFVVSAMARGGFSGGLALAEDGRALGVITESLVMNDGVPELGYMSVIGIEAAVDIIKNTYPSIAVHDSGFVLMETLLHIKLVEPDLRILNSRIHSASIYVYDDDRDLFGELYCADSKAAKIALAAFGAVCAISIYDSDKSEDSGNYVFHMLGNPPARDLVEAANNAKDALVSFGYEVASSFINSWQLESDLPVEQGLAVSTFDLEEMLKRDDDFPF